MSTDSSEALHACLVLSRATPLKRWHELGILERELAIFQRLMCKHVRLSILTSGPENEADYIGQLGAVQLLPNRWSFSPNMYSLLAPLLHLRTLRGMTLLRTNQLDGAWTAVLAGKLVRKPVIVRAGYLWVENYERIIGRGLKTALMRHLARFCLRSATVVVVTSARMKSTISSSYAIPLERIHILPNVVDTALFSPDPGVKPVKGQVIYVGRLSPEKNLPLLIQAMAEIHHARLLVVGDGPSRNALEKQASQLGVKAQFAGRVSNSQLPALLRRSELFALPSFFEGHPKAMIEAMSCALTVVGSNVEGINDVVRHKETGWLCSATVASWESSIAALLHDPALRERLGTAARRHVLSNYEVGAVADKELALLKAVAAGDRYA